MPATPPKTLLPAVFLVAALGSTCLFSPLLAQDAPSVLVPSSVIPAPAPGEPRHLPRLRALLASLDAQHSALLGLLPQMRADLHLLTVAVGDLSPVAFTVSRRALAICLAAPSNNTPSGGPIDVATSKINHCIDTFPREVRDQIDALPIIDRLALLSVLSTADTLRHNFDLTSPQIQAFSTHTSSALLEYAELAATITAEHELSKHNPFSSDASKARASAAYHTQKAALGVVETKLHAIASDLLKLPAEAVAISKAALALSSP